MPQKQFSCDISPFLLLFEKYRRIRQIFLRGIGWMKWVSGTRNLLWVWGSPFRVLDMWWVGCDPQKGIPSVFTRSIGTFGLQWHFSCRLCAGFWKTVFWPWRSPSSVTLKLVLKSHVQQLIYSVPNFVAVVSTFAETRRSIKRKSGPTGACYVLSRVNLGRAEWSVVIR